MGLKGGGTGGRGGRTVRANACAFSQSEEGDRGLELLGLGGQFLGGGGHLLRSTGVLLRHLVELLDGGVDLIGTDILFPRGGGDFRDQISGALDVGHEFR